MTGPRRVAVVGAGPGDPDLLTVKAARLLASCEVLAYDELVSPAVLALAPASAERIAVVSITRHGADRIKDTKLALDERKAIASPPPTGAPPR